MTWQEQTYLEMAYTAELYHHGIKGQKWGHRRYQNEDGSYKSGAEGRYYDEKPSRKRSSNSHSKSSSIKKDLSEALETTKKVAKVGAIIAGTAIAAYGAYKVADFVKTSDLKLNVGKDNVSKQLQEMKSKNNSALQKNLEDLWKDWGDDKDLADAYLASPKTASQDLKDGIEKLRETNPSLYGKVQGKIQKDRAKEISRIKKDTLRKANSEIQKDVASYRKRTNQKAKESYRNVSDKYKQYQKIKRSFK